MPRTIVKVGPADNGRRMSLEEFEHAEAEEGRLYELGEGVVSVVDVPNRRHQVQVVAIRRQLTAYELAHPGRIDTVAGGAECKLLIPSLETERHPDVAVYKVPPPQGAGQDMWSIWVPDLVVEVVSANSVRRDYEQKREEYLAFGVREYWIVDADREEVLVLRRVKGRWSQRVVRPPQAVRTRLLPGFELDCADVFRAAHEARTEE
jgi:Uma2 family endonuclease